jgi:Secretion system C-terminal sorting domain
MKKNFTKLLLACLTLSGFSNIQAQNEFYNDGADVYVQAAGLIFVQGDVINDDQGGNVGRIHNSGDIQLTGNWSNTSATSNVFDAFATGTTTFLGTGAVQTIGGTLDTYFNNLTINKSGGATQEVRQLRNSLCDGILALNNDFLNTQTFNFLVANLSPLAITRAGGNVSPNAYVHSTTLGYVTSTPGSLGRLGRATTAGQSYFFPVGNGARFRPVDIVTGAGAPNNVYSVQFVNLPTFSTNLKVATLSTINPAWYHFMERQVASAVPENIRIYHDFGPDNVCDINRVTMAEWNLALWDDLSVTTSNNPAPNMSWTLKSGYPGAYPTPWISNSFALAGLFILPNISSCVFPVEYLYLNATPQESSIMLNWETATEVNNAGFEVNRSIDGINFENVGFVQGAGNSSSPTPYNYDDRDVISNQRYFYRLRQVDFNGGEAISNTVEAILLKGQDYVVGGFFPNPSNGNVNLWMSLNADVDFALEVYNALGQIVHTEARDINSGYNKLDFDFSKLSSGSYIAHVKLGSEVVIRKLVIQ